jgi:Retrotransposon gag protein
MEHPSPEQQLSHQKMVINNLSARLVAMEEAASASAAALEQRLTATSPTSIPSPRYKPANPTSFNGNADTLKPWVRQVETHLQLSAISDPEMQFLVATQFLAAAPLTWVQTLRDVSTWDALKAKMVTFYQPLHEELRARDALHSLRQRGSVDDYAKAFTLLVVKVPQMTLEEQLYNFIKGLKAQVQVSVALQSPTTLEEAKLLASSADGILYQHRQYPGPTRFSPNTGSVPMELGATDLRRKRLDPVEFDRRRLAALCFECGKLGHKAYQHAADGSVASGN